MPRDRLARIHPDLSSESGFECGLPEGLLLLIGHPQVFRVGVGHVRMQRRKGAVRILRRIRAQQRHQRLVRQSLEGKITTGILI